MCVYSMYVWLPDRENDITKEWEKADGKREKARWGKERERESKVRKRERER